jgi:hypothetical protein
VRHLLWANVKETVKNEFGTSVLRGQCVGQTCLQPLQLSVLLQMALGKLNSIKNQVAMKLCPNEGLGSSISLSLSPSLFHSL